LAFSSDDHANRRNLDSQPEYILSTPIGHPKQRREQGKRNGDSLMEEKGERKNEGKGGGERELHEEAPPL